MIFEGWSLVTPSILSHHHTYYSLRADARCRRRIVIQISGFLALRNLGINPCGMEHEVKILRGAAPFFTFITYLFYHPVVVSPKKARCRS